MVYRMERPRPEGEEGKSQSEYEPNFVFSHKDAIREDNWGEFAAQDIRPVFTAGRDYDARLLKGMIASAQNRYGGPGNVYTGDVFDIEAQRPLRHKPGRQIYVTPAGFEYAQQQDAERQKQDQARIRRERERWKDQHSSTDQEEGDSDSAAN